MPFFSLDLMGSFEIIFVISVKFSYEMEMFEHENNSLLWSFLYFHQEYSMCMLNTTSNEMRNVAVEIQLNVFEPTSIRPAALQPYY